jgi:hypothetical protein
MRIIMCAVAALLIGTSSIGFAATATGPGPGQVWVNSDSKVYHCMGSQFYGKTKTGEYMSETAARKAGNKPAQDKACS